MSKIKFICYAHLLNEEGDESIGIVPTYYLNTLMEKYHRITILGKEFEDITELKNTIEIDTPYGFECYEEAKYLWNKMKRNGVQDTLNRIIERKYI